MRDRARFWGWTILLVAIGWSATRPARATTLPVPEVTQEQTYWCWAAVSEAVLEYYSQPVEQCEIVEYARLHSTTYSYGTTDCCVDPDHGCNQVNQMFDVEASTEDILNQRGLPNDGSWRTLTAEEVTAEIDAGRPFLFVWVYDQFSSHALVGHGFDGVYMDIMDPWFGEGHQIATYDWVLHSGNHDWWGTSTMDRPPCDCVETTDCCDGCHEIRTGLLCDDGDLCTIDDTCHEGACQPGTPTVCDPPAPCHEPGACEPTSGLCFFDLQPNGQPCVSFDPCTITATCQTGECLADTWPPDWHDCGDGHACFAGKCEDVPPGDDCSDPMTLPLNEPVTIDPTRFHGLRPADIPCSVREGDGPGIYLRVPVDSHHRYHLTLHGDDPPSVSAAAFDSCDAVQQCEPLQSGSIFGPSDEPWVFDSELDHTLVVLKAHQKLTRPLSIEWVGQRAPDPMAETSSVSWLIEGASCAALPDNVPSNPLWLVATAVLGLSRRGGHRTTQKGGRRANRKGDRSTKLATRCPTGPTTRTRST